MFLTKNIKRNIKIENWIKCRTRGNKIKMLDRDKKNSLLLLESTMANTLLLEGLDCLRHASIFEPGLYYQAFFSLSTGLERLLKIIFIYNYIDKNNGHFPQNSELRKFKHNIKKIVNIYAPDLLNTHIYNIIIEFITDFAERIRYYNLDSLTGKNNTDEPISIWTIIEVIILKNYKAKIPILNNNVLQNNINEIADVHYVLSDGTIIDNIDPILSEMMIKDLNQGYNVLVFYEIIKKLVDILVKYQGNCTYPDMKEIFKTFRMNYTKYEIRNKKKWRR